MGTQDLLDTLLTVVGERRLLDHPFYRRWSEGGLRRQELRDYAAQYRHVEAAMPRLWQGIASGCELLAVRAAVDRIRADELGLPDGPSHLDLFDDFAAALAASAAAPSAATAALIECLETLVHTSPVLGLAALGVYEVQSPEVSASKAEGLRRHYGLGPSAITFWEVHTRADVDHCRWLLEALDQAGADRLTVTAGGRAAAAAWWSFLDERQAVTG